MPAKQLSLKDPQTRILLITAGIIIITYFCAQKFIVNPHKEKINKLKNQLSHVQLEDEVSMLKNEVTDYEKKLSSQKDPSWLLTQITKWSKQADLNIESLEPLPIKQIPPYSYASFKIKSKCTYSQLMHFIKLIESNPQITNIESLKLETKEKYVPELPKEELNKEVEAVTEIIIGTIYYNR